MSLRSGCGAIRMVCNGRHDNCLTVTQAFAVAVVAGFIGGLVALAGAACTIWILWSGKV